MPNIEMVGLEPTTPALSKRCSNQLSYTSVMAEWTGLEPATSAVTGQRSNQLSYHSMSIATENRTPITWMKTKCPNR
jgi:hypothetical protein